MRGSSGDYGLGGASILDCGFGILDWGWQAPTLALPRRTGGGNKARRRPELEGGGSNRADVRSWGREQSASKSGVAGEGITARDWLCAFEVEPERVKLARAARVIRVFDLVHG
jgi:hypothetical protein